MTASADFARGYTGNSQGGTFTFPAIPGVFWTLTSVSAFSRASTTNSVQEELSVSDSLLFFILGYDVTSIVTGTGSTESEGAIPWQGQLPFSLGKAVVITYNTPAVQNTLTASAYPS